MTARPNMPARDSSGNQVSLLNDELATEQPNLPFRSSNNSGYVGHLSMARSNSNNSAQSSSSSPNTPGLVRADSFDSQNTHGPLSPITPVSLQEYGRQTSYMGTGYKDQPHYDYRERMTGYDDYSTHQYAVRPTFPESRSSSYADSQMYDEESYQNGSSERSQKRYPCRFRDSHNCPKTFTTSGHASRHSKIHTAEKGVCCTYAGCQKKFTRADNMKQHLETHGKDKSRGKQSLTQSAGVRKAGSAGPRPSSRNTSISDSPPVDPALFQHAFTSAIHSAASSPIFTENMGAFPPLPMGIRRESVQSGLDALAMAANIQTRGPQA
jgi:hypothetical protein